jgi:glycosyltransferase involved in cell wall biosynthesis
MIAKQNAPRQAPTLLLLVNVSWFFLSHRAPIAVGARRAGFAVHVGTRFEPEEDRERVSALGAVVHSVPFARGGANVLDDLGSLHAIAGLYRRVRPDIVHLVTLKPIIFGGLLARLMRIPGVVAAVPGLGYSFVATGACAAVRRRVLKVLLKAALGHRNCTVIFQNPDDLELLTASGTIAARNAQLIRGAGVDLERFSEHPEPAGPVRVVLASRMLREKGVPLFVAAARALREAGVDARFLLAGVPDPYNPGSVPVDELRRWHESGVVEWLGHVESMHELLQTVHVVCLPTHYGEGIPKVLIEAAAAGRPIVATDVPGCREIVLEGVNGLRVPPRDVSSLAAALRRLIEDAPLRHRLGRAGRELAVREFGVASVVEATLDVYRRTLDQAVPR